MGPAQVPCGCCSPYTADKLSPLSHLGQLEGEHECGMGGPDSPDTQASGPLAGTVRRLLYCVGHPGGIGGTEELHRATLQSHLTAALAEAGIRVDVVVVNAGRRAPPITRHQVHLEKERVSKVARRRSASPFPPPPEIPIPHSLHSQRCPSTHAQGYYSCSRSCGWSCGWSPFCRSAHLPYLYVKQLCPRLASGWASLVPTH